MSIETYIKYPAILLSAFLLTYLLTPLVRAGGRRLGLLDVPRGGRHTHAAPVPRCGGLAVFLGFHGACAVIFLLPWLPFSTQLTYEHWINMLVISSSLVMLGLLDDKIELWSVAKLAGQLTIAVAAYYLGFRAGKLIGFELPQTLDLALTVVWFVGIMNAFNLIDGIDGLATGLAIVASVGLAGNLILNRSPGDVLILLALLGACLAFLRYNFHPATIFLGDSGSMFLGFILAAVALGTGNKGTALASLTVPLLAFGIPLFDTLLAIWRRAVRGLPAYSKASPVPAAGVRNGIMEGDKDHLHHRLLKAGFSQTGVAVCLYMGGFAIVAAGLLTQLYENRGAGIYLVAFLAFAYLVMRHLATIELWDSGAVLVKGIRRPPCKVLAAIYYPVMDITLLGLTFAAALYVTNAWSITTYKAALLDGMPAWVGIPFIGLFATGCYKRVWSRARLLDYVIVGGASMAGVLVAVGFVLLLGAVPEYSLVQFTAIFGAAAPLCLTATRAMPRLVFEYMALARRRSVSWPDQKERQVLLYGAGFNCTLFLRALSFNPVVEREGYDIVGILDDDANLHGRLVYGYKVLGDINELERLIRSRQVDEIIVTTRKLNTPCQRKMRRIAAEANVAVLEWETGIAPISAINLSESIISPTEACLQMNECDEYRQSFRRRSDAHCPAPAHTGLLSDGRDAPAFLLRKAFAEQVERELGRSRRHTHACTLALFTVSRDNVPWALDIIGSVLRLDDSVGLVDMDSDHRGYMQEANPDEMTIGALLPETKATGARIVADRIADKLNGCCQGCGWAVFPQQASDYKSLVLAAREHQEIWTKENDRKIPVLPALGDPAGNTVLTGSA